MCSTVGATRPCTKSWRRVDHICHTSRSLAALPPPLPSHGQSGSSPQRGTCPQRADGRCPQSPHWGRGVRAQKKICGHRGCPPASQNPVLPGLAYNSGSSRQHTHSDPHVSGEGRWLPPPPPPVHPTGGARPVVPLLGRGPPPTARGPQPRPRAPRRGGVTGCHLPDNAAGRPVCTKGKERKECRGPLKGTYHRTPVRRGSSRSREVRGAVGGGGPGVGVGARGSGLRRGDRPVGGGGGHTAGRPSPRPIVPTARVPSRRPLSAPPATLPRLRP